jgi:hypothetical protein
MVVPASGGGAARQAVAAPARIMLLDTTAEGRLLIATDDLRASIRALVPGEASEREFAWLDFTYGGFLSKDRTFLVFTDESQSAGRDYVVTLRRVGESQVVPLGDGAVLTGSPDDKWVAALIPSTNRIVLYPTGPGEMVKIDKGPIESYRYAAEWFPDGRRLLTCGTDAAKTQRCYEQEVPGGTPRPVTPDGVVGAKLSHDGRTLVLSMANDTFQLLPLAWTKDDRAVVVMVPGSVPARVEQVDPVSGRRTMLRTLGPPDRAGVNAITVTDWIDDGRGYVYTYFRELTNAFVVSGVRP